MDDMRVPILPPSVVSFRSDLEFAVAEHSALVQRSEELNEALAAASTRGADAQQAAVAEALAAATAAAKSEKDAAVEAVAAEMETQVIL